MLKENDFRRIALGMRDAIEGADKKTIETKAVKTNAVAKPARARAR